MNLRSLPAPPVAPSPRDIVLRPAAIAKVWTGRAVHETMAVPGVVLAPGDVLVAVELATVGAADVEVAAGRRTPSGPVVLGGEGVGRVVAVGAEAGGAELGDRIVWASSAPCGACDRCLAGASSACARRRTYGDERIGAHRELTGTFATHVHLRAGTATVAIGERMPARVAAPAASGCGVAWAALRRAERIAPLRGAVVRVIGGGLVGLSATAIAADRGARVVVTEPDRHRRELALRFGAAAVVDPCEPEALDRALRAVGGEDADLTVDTGGAVPVVTGGTGGTGDPARVGPAGRPVLADVSAPTAADLAQAMAYLRSACGRHPFDDLVDPVLPLDAVDDALRLARTGSFLRVGIDPRR